MVSWDEGGCLATCPRFALVSIVVAVVICANTKTGSSYTHGENNEHRRPFSNLQLRRYARLVFVACAVPSPYHATVGPCDLGASALEAWIVRGAKRQSINYWITTPFLFATLMIGPAGLMSYLLLRLVMKRTVSLAETGV